MAVKRVEDLEPVYLIQSKEELLLARALRRLKDMVVGETGTDMDMDVFEGPQASADAIIGAANTLPFLASKRLVVVRDVERLAADEQARLVEYVKDPAPTSVLVLVTQGLPKNTRLYKALEAAGAVAEYAAPTRRTLPQWVRTELKEHGRTIDADAVESLVRAVGSDLRRLATEIEKIVTYLGERERVTRDDVEAIVEKTAPPSIFEFLDALGSRDAHRAIILLGRLLGSGEPVLGVHAMAVRHVRMLMSVKALDERGATFGEMMRELKVADWQLKNLIPQAGRFDRDELVEALKDAAEAERRMKTSQGDPRLVFERWVIGVCARRDATRAVRG